MIEHLLGPQYSTGDNLDQLTAPMNSKADIQNLKQVQKPYISTTRRWIAYVVLVLGLLILAWGCFLETRNPRSNTEDDFAILVLGAGVSLSSFGMSLRFLRPVFAAVIAILAPPIAFGLAVAIFWACLIAYALIQRLT